MPSQISTVTAPVTTRYTSLATVKTELVVSGSSDDDFLTTLIDEASERISAMMNRPLYRAQYKETLAGSGTRRQTLSRLPVVSVDVVTLDGSAQTLSEFTIEDGEAGFIYHEAGFSKSSDPTDWAITYTAGYFCPADDQSGTTLSAAASDDSFNDSASGFPLTLRDGDVINGETNWTDTANEGRHVVSGTPTAAKIITTSALVDEAEGSTRTLLLRNLPGPIERACIELVKSAYTRRDRDQTVASLKVGDFTITWGPAVLEQTQRELSRWVMY